MNIPREQTPSILAEEPEEGGDIRSRWERVEPVVWTERMLAALETGLEGQCLLHRDGADMPETAPSSGVPISIKSRTTNWRAGCGKSASPVRREGER